MTKHGAGKKIASDTLYQQQQYKPAVKGPQILATNLRTPENIGSLFRVADATACEKIVLLQSDGKDTEYETIIRRVARGTDKRINREHWDLNDFKAGKDNLNPLIAIELTTEATNIFNTRLPENCCFVIGSERRGVDDTVLQSCSAAVKIPMYGNNGSMNVTHALAICLYEWHRQHTEQQN